MMGDRPRQRFKEEDREKSRFRVEVRNRKRPRQNEDRNEDSDGPREDKGKQHRFGGRDMAGGKRDSLKVVGQDGVQETGGGTRGIILGGEKVHKSEVRNWDRPGSDWG